MHTTECLGLMALNSSVQPGHQCKSAGVSKHCLLQLEQWSQNT